MPYITQRHSRIQRHLGGVPGLPTFTRSGVAYDPYAGAAYADGQPRFPVVGGRQGVMVEEAGANLVSQASLAARGTGVTAGVGTSSKYGLTSKRVTMGATLQADWGLDTTATAGSTGVVYTVSFDAMQVSGGATVRVTLLERDGALGLLRQQTSGFLALSATELGRLSVTFAATGASTANIQAVISGNSANQVFEAVGVQIEAKTYATSFANTARNAETLTIPTAGVLNLSQGAIIIPVYCDANMAASTATQIIFQHREEANSNNRVGLFVTGSLLFAQTIGPTGTATNVNTARSILTTGWHTLGINYSPAGVSLWADGSSRGTPSTSANLPTVALSSYLGSSASANHWNLPLGSVHIFREMLPDSLMAQFTSGAPIPRTPYHSLYLPLDTNLATYGRGFSLADYSAMFGGDR